jgi:hypothetical protein
LAGESEFALVFPTKGGSEVLMGAGFNDDHATKLGECGGKVSGKRKWGDECGRHPTNQNICCKSTGAKFALENPTLKRKMESSPERGK